MRLDHKVTIITGGTQGIGRAMAIRFASAGAAVVFCGRNDKKGKAVEQEIRELGGEVTYIQADISVEKDVINMVNSAIEKYSKIDVLVNNAAVYHKGTPFFEMSKDLWQQILDVNVTGMFLCSREVSRHMIKRKQGKIINIGSVFSFAGSTATAPYAVSKAGVIQLTKAMAIDLAPYNIVVNAIAPGAIATELSPEIALTDNVMGDYILQKRWGTVDDVAGLALFLSSEESSYINGTTIIIDGGLMTLLPGKPIGTS